MLTEGTRLLGKRRKKAYHSQQIAVARGPASVLVHQVLTPTEKSRGPYDVCTGNGWHHKKGTPSLQNVNLGNGQSACLPLATEVHIMFCLTMSLPAFCSKEDAMSFRTLSALTLRSSRRHYFYHSETFHI